MAEEQNKSVEERNKRLDELVTAVKEWADKRVARMEKNATRLKTVLKGRTGAERIAVHTASATTGVVVDTIEDFLRSE
jgi:hypothetical protein